jgi:hypothetical protein
MSGPTQEEADEFLGVTAELLTLVFADDLDRVEQLRDSVEDDWWNVSLTRAYLMRDVFSGKPEALAILAQMFEDARGLREESGG